jgi:hypothetical protein
MRLLISVGHVVLLGALVGPALVQLKRWPWHLSQCLAGCRPSYGRLPCRWPVRGPSLGVWQPPAAFRCSAGYVIWPCSVVLLATRTGPALVQLKRWPRHLSQCLAGCRPSCGRLPCRWPVRGPSLGVWQPPAAFRCSAGYVNWSCGVVLLATRTGPALVQLKRWPR